MSAKLILPEADVAAGTGPPGIQDSLTKVASGTGGDVPWSSAPLRNACSVDF